MQFAVRKKMEITKIDIETVKEYIKHMYSLKPKYCNYFNQQISTEDLFCKTDHSLMILKSDNGYQRVFIMSVSFEDAVQLLSSLKGIHVVNIPSKGDISDWQNLVTVSGFEKMAIYERYSNTQIKKLCSTEKIVYAGLNQEKDIYDLFHESNFFSRYTDYLPSHSELKQLIEQNRVIINERNGNITGAFIFSIEGIKCYFRAWIDKNKEGIKLLLEVYSLMYEKGVSYVYFWVNSENMNVKSIHQLLGAKPDGLKDYTFIKK